MRRAFQGRGGMVLAFVLGLVIATAGTAGAARLITGKQIKDGSITSQDLSKALRKTLAATAKDGPQGPQGPKGDPGKDATAAPPQRTSVTGPSQDTSSCIPAYNVFCGSVSSGNYWASASGGSYAPLSYAVEPSGFVQLEGTAQRTGSIATAAPFAQIIFYLPQSAQPQYTLRFPVVRIKPGSEQTPADPVGSAYVRVGDNGEVAVVDKDFADGARYDLSGIRFRTG